MRLRLEAAWVIGLAAAAAPLAAQGPEPPLPPVTLLYQNFPNPFPALGRDATCLSFDLAVESQVELIVLDLRGGPVRHFVPGPSFGSFLNAGRYGRMDGGGCDPRLMWDGRTDDGRVVPAGVYLYKLRAGGVLQFRRMVFSGRPS
ncbi:MAG TPA: hypothetical protein VLV16_01750 [Gemmatimonadales bacterium]|nr:hypothetical protein [Gemmatimonadales bacterium]